MAPLSALLSHALVAFTIELDNEFERQLRESGQRSRVTSFVMWANFMRFVGDGIAVAELPAAAGSPSADALDARRDGALALRVRRTRPCRRRRDGFGSARGASPGLDRSPTHAGARPSDLASAGRRDRGALGGAHRDRRGRRASARARAIAGQLEYALPEYVPIVGGSSWPLADAVATRRATPRRGPLSALLSRALLAYTIAFERESELALPLSANLVRVLDEGGVSVNDVPLRGGISKEAVAMATTFLAKHGYVVVEAETIRLTRDRQREAQAHADAAARRGRAAGRAARHLLARSRRPARAIGAARLCLRPHRRLARSKPYLRDEPAEDPRCYVLTARGPDGSRHLAGRRCRRCDAFRGDA